MTQLAALDDLKAWLSIDATNTASDQVLSRLLAAASAFVESWTDRTFTQQPYTETYDGNGKSELSLRQFPVASVASVLIDDRYIPAYGAGVPSGWFTDRDTVCLRGYSFARGKANVQIAYVAGFYVIPDDIQQGVIELAAYRWRERTRIGMSSVTAEGQTTAFQTRDMPTSVATLLAQYKRVYP
jgi:uncharacterized phiE125 gp8 family phage protein